MTSIQETTIEYGRGGYGEAKPEHPIKNWEYYQVHSILGHPPTEREIEQVKSTINLRTRQPWSSEKEPNFLQRWFNKFNH